MPKERCASPRLILTDAQATAIPNPAAGDIKQYRKDNGLWYEKNSAGTETRISHVSPIKIDAPAIVINNQAVANSVSNALTQNVTLPYDGDYTLTISFNYNNNSANSDIAVFATFNGNAVDLNNRAGDPQGVNQILRAECKDAANSPGGAITGTGSGQKYCFNMPFFLSGQTSGTYPLVIDVGSETANIASAIWNIKAVFEYDS